jgi:hypothetical protein
MFDLPAWVGPIVFVPICGLALWKGGWEERVAAIGFLLSLSVTYVFVDTTWPEVQKAIFAADTSLLVLLLAVALRGRRYWPMAAASVQLLAVLTHIAKLVDRGTGQWAYMTAEIIWTYLLLAALGIGAYRRWRSGRIAARASALTRSR